MWGWTRDFASWTDEQKKYWALFWRRWGSKRTGSLIKDKLLAKGRKLKMQKETFWGRKMLALVFKDTWAARIGTNSHHCFCMVWWWLDVMMGMERKDGGVNGTDRSHKEFSWLLRSRYFYLRVKTYLGSYHTGCQWDIQKNERQTVIMEN